MRVRPEGVRRCIRRATRWRSRRGDKQRPRPAVGRPLERTTLARARKSPIPRIRNAHYPKDFVEDLSDQPSVGDVTDEDRAAVLGHQTLRVGDATGIAPSRAGDQNPCIMAAMARSLFLGLLSAFCWVDVEFSGTEDAMRETVPRRHRRFPGARLCRQERTEGMASDSAPPE